VTEAEFTSLLRAALKRHGLASDDATCSGGWRVSHDPNSVGQDRGEPDLCCDWLLGAGPCPGPLPHFLLELKTTRGRRTDSQRRFANALIIAGQVVLEIVVPTDSDQVEALFGLPAGALATDAPPPVKSNRQPARGSAASGCRQMVMGADLSAYSDEVVAAVREWTQQVDLSAHAPAVRQASVRAEARRLAQQHNAG
jgi:hypothetical protein